MQSNLLSYSPTSDIVAYAIVFILGIAVKSKMQLGRTNTDALKTLTADYQAIKELYNTKCDEIKRKNEQLLTQGQEILELRARIKSYDNFLSIRAPETDRLIKGIADHLGISDVASLQAHEVAHSQGDKQGGQN